MYRTVFLILPDGVKKINVRQDLRSVRYCVPSQGLGVDVMLSMPIEGFYHEGQLYYICKHSGSVDVNEIILAINEHQ